MHNHQLCYKPKIKLVILNENINYSLHGVSVILKTKKYNIKRYLYKNIILKLKLNVWHFHLKPFCSVLKWLILTVSILHSCWDSVTFLFFKNIFQLF